MPFHHLSTFDVFPDNPCPCDTAPRFLSPYTAIRWKSGRADRIVGNRRVWFWSQLSTGRIWGDDRHLDTPSRCRRQSGPGQRDTGVRERWLARGNRNHCRQRCLLDTWKWLMKTGRFWSNYLAFPSRYQWFLVTKTLPYSF